MFSYQSQLRAWCVQPLRWSQTITPITDWDAEQGPVHVFGMTNTFATQVAAEIRLNRILKEHLAALPAQSCPVPTYTGHQKNRTRRILLPYFTENTL